MIPTNKNIDNVTAHIYLNGRPVPYAYRVLTARLILEKITIPELPTFQDDDAGRKAFVLGYNACRENFLKVLTTEK